MHGFHFISSAELELAVLPGTYNSGLVALSVFLAVLASYAGFSQLEIIRQQQSPRGRLLWYSLGALTLGAGVWSMHFIGMLAYELPFPVHYDIVTTLISLVPAVIAGYVTLRLIVRKQPAHWQVLVAGVLMGAGIGSMHYIGMAAMRTEAMMFYRPGLFLLSLVVAIALAVMALYSRYWLQHGLQSAIWVRSVAALLLGLAVSGMHYTAMAAMVFVPGLEPMFVDGTFAEGPLTQISILVAGFIICVATVSALMVERLTLLQQRMEASEREAHRLNQQLQRIADRVPGMVYQFERTADGRYRYPYASEAIQTIYRVTPEQVKNDANILTNIIHPDDYSGVIASIEHSAKTMEPWLNSFRVCFSDGSVRWLLGNSMPEAGDAGSVIWNGFIMDITEQKKTEERIHRLANYDPLTQLPNRQFLLSLLDQALKESRNSGSCLMIIALDADDLHYLEASEGPALVDAVLRGIASVLEKELQHGDIVARTGDSQFTLVWTALGSDECQARRIAEQRLHQLRERLIRHCQGYLKTLSAGITMANDGALEELLAQSSVALNSARQNGAGYTAYFDVQAQAALRERRQREDEFQQALQRQQLELFLQPQFDATGMDCIGAEALVRWRHPQRGLIGPDEFIPLAEEMDLIVELGNTVLDQACAILQRWQRNTATAGRILSVNVSAAQFWQDDFVQTVMGTLQRYGLSPHMLKLEITESMAMENPAQAINTMNTLQQHGVRFSMDDFGTGYSSLSYFSRLPFNEVKIDKSFIQADMNEQGRRDWMIVEVVISMATRMGMTVVAEGVETTEQHQRLQQQGCPVVQGYLFGRPVAVAEFEQRWGG